ATEGHDAETARIAHRRGELRTRDVRAHGRSDDGDVDSEPVAEPRAEHVAGYHAPDGAATRDRERRRLGAGSVPASDRPSAWRAPCRTISSASPAESCARRMRASGSCAAIAASWPTAS